MAAPPPTFKDIKMYKVKRIKDGLFSKGGQNPYFTKTGKVWTTLQGLKLHLNQFLRKRNDGAYVLSYFPYSDCRVIEYNDQTGGITEDAFDVIDYLTSKAEEFEERDKERDRSYEIYLQKLKELQEYKREHNIV